MLQPNRESLEVTINKIKKNEILLPDFQRQFVWKEEEMQHKLVASVLTKMPIGSILLLKSKDAHDYSCKPLGAKDPIPSEQLPSGAVEFLLDGQQRMTVLANVFSDAIFQLTPQSNNLIAPSALKRRFYLAVPKYGNDAFPDLFGLHSLSFPMRTPDSDEPEFLTQDILPFIRVVPFNVKRDNGKCYNSDKNEFPKVYLETFLNMKKILIVCGAGASSGFMAKNIRLELKKRGMTADFEFIARSDTELDEYIDSIDMLLIGPHLRYMLQGMTEYCKPYHIPVYVIDQNAYGALDGGAIIDFVIQKFKEKENCI